MHTHYLLTPCRRVIIVTTSMQSFIHDSLVSSNFEANNNYYNPEDMFSRIYCIMMHLQQTKSNTLWYNLYLIKHIQSKNNKNEIVFSIILIY